jgi:hypothetical protein
LDVSRGGGVTNDDDPVADVVGPTARQLSRQAYRAVRRLSTEGRAALSGIPLSRKHLPAAVAALSALPRRAGAAAVGTATAPFRKNGSEAEVFLGKVPQRRREAPYERQWFCAFCDCPASEFGCRVVTGRDVCICENCLEAAAATLSAMDAGARAHDSAVGPERCGFCEKPSGFDVHLGHDLRLLAGPRTMICEECVAFFVPIFDEDESDERDLRAEELEHCVRNLSSPDFYSRCLAAVSLDHWGFVDDPIARDALVAALADKNWRVRALAEATLSKAGALPDGYRPSFVGRLRSLELMEIVAAKNRKALEKAPTIDSP